MPTLSNMLIKPSITTGGLRRFSGLDTASESHLWSTNNSVEYTIATAEHPTPISTRVGIIVAAYLTMIMLGLLYVAVSVLPVHTARVPTRCQTVESDDNRFATRNDRAIEASLVAVDDQRSFYTQHQMAKALELLRRSPREVYIAWAARTGASSHGTPSTRPLW